MDSEIVTPEVLTRLCTGLDPEAGVEALAGAINDPMPGLPFRWVLSRGGWHRLGGVVDGSHGRVAGNVVRWVQENCDGDVDQLVAEYADSGYLATRLAGKTHFFTAARGELAEDFIQIEIEELQEVVERPLIEPGWFPDSVEEFLEPLEHSRVEMQPVGRAYYQFRRITSVSHLISMGAVDSRQMHDVKRFLNDWHYSSAGDHATFCDHWVLALREYRDREGDMQLLAKPVPAGVAAFPEPPQAVDVRGSKLAGAIHTYDRELGYPFAWYFMMLSQKTHDHALADAVLADQMGAYDYLPRKDLKVLREWEQRPYGV